jgi:hypothetical protein
MIMEKFNSYRWRFLVGIVLCVILAIFSTGKSWSKEDDVTGTLNCKELGRAQGLVQYQYDVTLNNNTDVKLKVDYQVILLAGDVKKKVHSHSTLLIPKEKLTETNYGSMNENDWDQITGCNAEWQWNQL